MAGYGITNTRSPRASRMSTATGYNWSTYFETSTPEVDVFDGEHEVFRSRQAAPKRIMTSIRELPQESYHTTPLHG